MVAWHNGGRWAMVVLRPGEIAGERQSDALPRSRGGLRTRRESRRIRGWLSTRPCSAGPTEPVAWIGRGTAEYRAGNFANAARDYAAALRLDPDNAGARNNLAQSLLDLGCPARAREQLAPVNIDALAPPLRDAVLDTRRHIDAAVAASPVSDPSRCAPQP